MNIIDSQWKDIMENNVFTEEGEFILKTGEDFKLSGVFFSGSYSYQAKAEYTNKRWERGDYFQISLLSLPEFVTDPVKMLRNAQILITGRGLFNVHQVKGAQSGMLTLQIQPKEYNNAQ